MEIHILIEKVLENNIEFVGYCCVFQNLQEFTILTFFQYHKEKIAYHSNNFHILAVVELSKFQHYSENFLYLKIERK